MEHKEKHTCCCDSNHSHQHDNCHHCDEHAAESSCGCHHHHHDHEGHDHRVWLAPAVSFVMLVTGMIMSHCDVTWFATHRWVEFAWYFVAFLPVGLPVVKEAVEGIAHHDFFNEFTLMVLACVGAFAIWELPEAVGVMLFYSVGETLQHLAVGRARNNISKLLDVRGDHAHVLQDGNVVDVDPSTVTVGQIIEVRPGERVPLDGVVLNDNGATFDTSALTGESVPRDLDCGAEALAGMISLQQTVRVKVNKEYSQSTLARILQLVEQSSSRKAHAELFIRKFARIYTPVVIILAALVVLIPAIVSLFVPGFHFVFADWLYRALVFLVISCPCALVVSVPLGYFAGIGAASRAGILFKGGNYLEAITHVNVVAFDKTGTLTTGRFSVVSVSGDDAMLALMAAAESGSSHPLARALVDYVKSHSIKIPAVESMTERAGHGAKARVAGGREVVVGNLRMLREEAIAYPDALNHETDTIIVCALNGVYAGYVTLADTLKDDARSAVNGLHSLGINDVVMLSGDRAEIVEKVASQLSITEAHGELLPQDKAAYVERIANTQGRNIAFVGDGMNDAPVLALSNVGVAMGTLGSDAAIESADVVIQTDQPSRLVTAIKIGLTTHTIVTENIVGAIAIKVLILALGAAGYASLWAAVFADVGVALLAILNSMRIMWKKY